MVELLIRHNPAYLLRGVSDDLRANASELSARIPAWTGTMPQETWRMIEQVAASTIGCVYASVAWVEASINEVLVDAEAKSSSPSVVRLEARSRDLVGALWPKFPRKPDGENELVWKLTHTLAVVGASLDSATVQEFRLLIRLRNALTHGKPEALPHNAGTVDSELGRLAAALPKRFPDAVGPDKTYTYIWVRCLGAGCAEWAYATSARTLAEWCFALGKARP